MNNRIRQQKAAEVVRLIYENQLGDIGEVKELASAHLAHMRWMADNLEDAIKDYGKPPHRPLTKKAE